MTGAPRAKRDLADVAAEDALDDHASEDLFDLLAAVNDGRAPNRPRWHLRRAELGEDQYQIG